MGQPSTGTESRSAIQERHYRMGTFIQALIAANTDPGRMIGPFRSGEINRDILTNETRSMGGESATPSLGGFLVSKEFQNSVYEKAFQTGSLYDRCRKLTIGANKNGIELPFVDCTNRADGSRPFRGYWTGEGNTLTSSTAKWGKIEMSLKKLTILTYLTSELFDDAVALGQWTEAEMARELKFNIEDSFINGSGAGQPLGILNSAALVTQAKETGQAATSLNWQNIQKMYSRLWAPIRSNMIWLINQDCLPQLLSMHQTVGTGGIPVWIPGDSASNRPFDTLLGRPVLVLEQCQTLGTKGDIILYDPQELLVIEKGGFQFAISAHVKFTTDEITLRGIFRVDAQPLWNNVLTPFKGSSNTQSPFITLAART